MPHRLSPGGALRRARFRRPRIAHRRLFDTEAEVPGGKRMQVPRILVVCFSVSPHRYPCLREGGSPTTGGEGREDC